MEPKKVYVTGAKVYAKHVAFDDCPHCEGQGYFDESSRWSYRTRRAQCLHCAIRHGDPQYIDLKAAQKHLEKEARQQIKVNARGRLTPEQVQAIEDFQDSDIAQAYRRLLRIVWGTYTPPQEVTA